MASGLVTNDPDLRDLAHGSPPLVEARRGRPTGVTLIECLGVGGMSTVFRAALDPARRSGEISPMCPRQLAIKVMKPSTLLELEALGLGREGSFEREAISLQRIMDRRPPTEFVVGFYGRGHVEVTVGARPARLPWLALELVDGGVEGTSLADRIARARDGCDPVRALRLARGVCEGARALHEEGIIHRDLKPDNVLVVGPIDDETPKIADCGVARVDGLLSTIAALTFGYGAPEQLVSRRGESNPLVGPWTDVHALAAVIWYMLGGEPWCRGRADRGWRDGARRSLRTARRLHPAFADEPGLLEELDAVLARGASPVLPSSAGGGVPHRATLPPGAEPRFESIAAFEAALLPLLDAAAARSIVRAAQRNHAATSFRSTQPIDLDDAASAPLLAEVIDLDLAGAARGGLAPARAGGVAFQPGGRALARFGGQLLLLAEGATAELHVPAAEAAAVAATEHVTRGPGGGFALIGRAHVRLLRTGTFRAMPLPVREGGGEVGEIEASIGDGRAFGVITAETEDSEGGPELWISRDGARWIGPTILPLGGRARAIASGPYGYMIAGASAKGNRARALFLGFDGQATVYTMGVNTRPPLEVALCGADRASWAAGHGFVLAFDRASVTAEEVEVQEAPAAMGLDPVGVPWLVTASAVMRRHARIGAAAWRAYHRQEPGAPPLVAIGFTAQGARVLDASGRGAQIVPHDIAAWRGLVSLAARG